MIRRCLAALLMLLPLAAFAQAQQATQRADSFTPAQRAEIVAVLRHALATDPSILRDAVAALRADERARQDAAVTRAELELTRGADDPVAGDAAGRVTLVEFYDVRCPYCRRMVPVVAELLRREPRLRLVYKDIPILGPPSVLGARALLAARRQGGYARLHDAVMSADAPSVTLESLQAQAAAVGLDWPRLQRDMADPAIAERLEANVALAHRLGIEGTPAYVVGGRLLPGAVGLAELQAAVAAARGG